ncbi:hypothetical protein MTR67_009011 [Solanum verrucosum]|uniref:BHLH domain-containing protein n=1 Tax=Solanum verrucosum TaxID=315347 RepID=A0AAF0Q7Y4_SOLVR|nr:hypothetical protein MTR67_009011 [Solanum verrucosum]
MYIAITLKRYRAVKEAGEIKMHVGSVAYYQLMLVCQSAKVKALGRLGLLASCCSYSAKPVEVGNNYQFSPQKPFVSLEDNAAGGNIFDIPAPSVFGTVALPTGFKSSVPFHGFEFQSSEACPKNFIIFDQTDYRSQIMYHPAMASKFPYPDLNYNSTCFQNGMERKIVNNENTEVSSYLKEDSDDINALLSLEEEEHEEYDEEEVSTARTDANYGCSSPESYSNYDCQSKKSRTSSFRKSSGSSTSNCSERKRRKLKKMVKVLKGIIPGASRMNTVTVLDEAVRYLKSLKMEVQKLGVDNLKTYA